MNRRQALRAIAAFAPALLQTSVVTAESKTKSVVIGLLDAGERAAWWDAFQQQLRELGYVEGRDVRFERRYAKGKLDELPALAKELVQLDVAVIVTGGAAAAVAAQR